MGDGRWAYVVDGGVRHRLEPADAQASLCFVTVEWSQERWLTDAAGMGARRDCKKCVKLTRGESPYAPPVSTEESS